MENRQSTNWRETLRKNQHKTIGVISAFVFIYLALGFIIDVYINQGFVADQFIPVSKALLSFQIIPLATLATTAVAIVSLIITFALYDKIMLLGTEYHEITADNAKSPSEQQLYHLVEEMKIAAGLNYMPKVFLIDANYMNAFASGYSEKSAMMAITRGLAEKLNREELQAVIAHELSHIRHGDIKLTLAASILSNIMLIVLDIFFYNALFSRNNRNNDNKFVVIIIVLRYLLPIITMLLILFLSRTREYMADAGSVELMRDNSPLGRALLKISQDHDQDSQACQEAYVKTPHENVRRSAYIFDPFTDGFHPIKSLSSLFATHPPIPDRLKAIGYHEEK